MEMEFERDCALGADLDISSIEAEKIRQIERMVSRNLFSFFLVDTLVSPQSVCLVLAYRFYMW